MMKIKLSTMVITAIVFLTSQQFMQQASAQNLKHFTLEDLNFGGKNYHNMIPQNRWTAWWGDNLVHLDVDKCSIIDKLTGKEKTLLTVEQFNKWAGNTQEARLLTLADASFPYPDKPVIMVEYAHLRQLFNFKTHKIVWTQSTQGFSHSDWNATSKATAYVNPDDYQLHVIDANGNDHQVSTDASRNILYGQSVHQNEFGYTKGTFFSPDGTMLAFTRMDQSMVPDYPLVDIPEPEYEPESGTRMAKPAPFKYPMAGEPMHKVTIGVYNLLTNKTVYLKAGDPIDRYFTNVAWSPDSKIVYLFELNRAQNNCKLVSYNAETGDRLAELYHETDAKYVEPQHPILFLPWDNSKFILQSQRDGYNHLYLFNKDGQLLKQLTKGPWVVENVVGFNPDNHSIIILSNECNPIQRNIFSVNVDSGKRTRIDEKGIGWHTAQLSPSGKFVVDSYSAPDIPRNIAVVNTENAKTTRYFTAENPWKDYAVPEYKCGTIKAADGQTDLYYRMVLPLHFDPNKKYPAIVYVYGGPHAHNVDARWHWGSRSWETYMAQNGYLLFIVDNRGSENRGRDFEQVTFHHLGDVEMQDQMKGVDFLKSLPYVDADKLGVHGWSFGGFMTINLMTTYPDVFKVGVAGGPVIDWKWYEIMYGERYMGRPQDNHAGYLSSSLIPKAKNLKGRLEIIIGLNDPVVLPQHTFSFLKQCINDGIQPDLFVYPGEPHNMRGHQSTHLHERISRYFFDYLK
ncbi:MAG: DPP IV N-terminal domain-containing protein [Prevotellaceae bacterium]|nr:DPP IV N-terminal domain-containing protein [Prevotellaceae bacterium]